MSESANCSVALSDFVLNFTAQITGDNRSSEAPEESHPVPPSPERRKFGQLGKQDILEENLLGDDVTADHSSLKAASFDISPSLIAVSTRTGLLEKVFYDVKAGKKEYCIYAHPHDTVLIVSREYISLPKNIAGYVVSRVSNVVKGFGHISTSVDPGWKGALLIALSNPSGRYIKVKVGDEAFERRGEDNPTLATVTFHYLYSADGGGDKESYEGMRKDLLKQFCNVKENDSCILFQNNRLRRRLARLTHWWQRKPTKNLYEHLTKMNEPISIDKWKDILKKLSGDGMNKTDEDYSCTIARYAWSDSRFITFWHGLVEHKFLVKLVLIVLVSYIVLSFNLFADKGNAFVAITAFIAALDLLFRS